MRHSSEDKKVVNLPDSSSLHARVKILIFFIKKNKKY